MLTPEPTTVIPPKSERTEEHERLLRDSRREANWKRWGPYLSDRQWATVREDYSEGGSAWDYFTHEHSRYRAYRWGEDGIMGFTDRECRLCFAPTMWNGRDSIVKERYFGVTGSEGNHGEDVKELYYYLDSTPTHSYCHGLYKYPMEAFPYQELLERNKQASKTDPEFELLDTGLFNDGAYFDVNVEYAKDNPDSMLIRITVSNRSPSRTEEFHFAPNLWFRNTWSWGLDGEAKTAKPRMWLEEGIIKVDHETLEKDWSFYAEREPEKWLFTENETNYNAIGFTPPPNASTYTKDAFHSYIVNGETEAVNPEQSGTKTTPYYRVKLAPGESTVFKFRLKRDFKGPKDFGTTFDETFKQRMAEADEFYALVIPESLNRQETLVSRQAYAGLLFSKQFYYYVVREWVHGDPTMGPPPVRHHARNGEWIHFHARDVISMPDKWEYPWFAVWDLAFHMVAFVNVDPEFTKQQLMLFLREWYLHPSGMMPAYEWDFNSVNPPVHAWACWRVYRLTGSKDRLFLERCFHKLLINFTWWVNRKDTTGSGIFTGGFLGLDNISIFDRNDVDHLEQADATSWMAFFCSYMLTIALELAQYNPAMEDIASKFFEHFVMIIGSINTFGGTGLWDEQDGFFYDCYRAENGERKPLRIRSVVGLIPLTALCLLDKSKIESLPGFKKRMDWFMTHQKWLSHHIESNETTYLISVVNSAKLQRVMEYVADPEEFLSPYGIRSLSRFHKDHPYSLHDQHHDPVFYIPGESDSYMFGGNSNWRGPIWFPVNSLLIEAIRKYHRFLGPKFEIEYPSGSGAACTLQDIAEDLALRTASIFLPRDKNDDFEGYEDINRVEPGCRPCHGNVKLYKDDPHFKELVLFYEYFHGDTGLGLGASHQTGWTGLVALHLQQIGLFVKEHPDRFKMPSAKDCVAILRASSSFIKPDGLLKVSPRRK